MTGSEIGPITLIGSGETAPSAHRIFSHLFQALNTPVQVAILETPAGFEPNSYAVANAVSTYLAHHLQNHRPEIEIISARRKGTPVDWLEAQAKRPATHPLGATVSELLPSSAEFSTDSAAIAAPLLHADFLFMGPGSPTYAARHLMESYVWHAMLARHRLGASICFSSASTISVSRDALPVYEIYKVGEELHWQRGLDFFAAFGLDLTIIPHWNNNDGGEALDTSHCYMGQARYDRLIALLPPERTILGLDENTALVIQPSTGQCQVIGPGGVRIMRQQHETRFASGSRFPATELGPWSLPDPTHAIPEPIWEAALQAQQAAKESRPLAIPDRVTALATAREEARAQRDWALADHLRDQISALGWQVNDGANGPEFQRLE